MLYANTLKWSEFPSQFLSFSSNNCQNSKVESTQLQLVNHTSNAFCFQEPITITDLENCIHLLFHTGMGQMDARCKNNGSKVGGVVTLK